MTSELQCMGGTGKPLFIVGQPRTGTTALMLALNNHPAIWLTPEWRTVHLLSAGLDWNGVLRYYQARCMRPWGLLRWIGDKSPWFRDLYDVNHYFDKLPDARIIWLHRCPVEQVRSIMEHNPTVGLTDMVNEWIRDWEVRHSRVEDERILFLSYEALTAAPDNVLAGVFDWLGVEKHDRLGGPIRQEPPRSVWSRQVINRLTLEQLRDQP